MTNSFDQPFRGSVFGNGKDDAARIGVPPSRPVKILPRNWFVVVQHNLCGYSTHLEENVRHDIRATGRDVPLVVVVTGDGIIQKRSSMGSNESILSSERGQWLNEGGNTKKHQNEN
jgi:hypothetical protein